MVSFWRKVNMTGECTPCMISQKRRGKLWRSIPRSIFVLSETIWISYWIMANFSHDGARHQWHKLNISLSLRLSCWRSAFKLQSYLFSGLCFVFIKRGFSPFPTLLHNIIFHNIILFSVWIFYVFPSVYICFARLCFFARRSLRNSFRRLFLNK